MGTEHVIEVVRRALEMALWLGGPLLLIATVVSLVINLVQVLTSLQDVTVSTVPRLAAVAAAALLLLPWMVRRLDTYTVQLFSDFHPFLR